MQVPHFNPMHYPILEKGGVQAIYLFGSRAQGKENPLSDYDYAVLLKEKGYSKGDPLYFQLYNLFSEVSPRTLKNDVIDIIFLRDAGLELRFHVIRYGVVLYDKNPKERLDFESETMILYCDYRPLLDEFDQAILERV
jgi:predicted nucleotidyltransferase